MAKKCNECKAYLTNTENELCSICKPMYIKRV